jgi:hypothetical protein
MNKSYDEILNEIFDDFLVRLANNSDVSLNAFIYVANSIKKFVPKVQEQMKNANPYVCKAMIEASKASLSRYDTIAKFLTDKEV